jgi:tripartite-type tricarboxylate transporter receptor subunit TctC
MVTTWRKRVFVAGLLFSLLAMAPQAAAQSYPSQRITVIVPLGAGGVTNIVARIFAEEMGRRWSQQVIVENRPGLAGTASVARSPADGYTLMMTSAGITVARLVSKDAPFDPVRDFVGITRVAAEATFFGCPPGFSRQNS